MATFLLNGINYINDKFLKIYFSLEIKKVYQKINDTQTKIELWDTNLSILNSLLVKSNTII